jgi:hypothetical protein
MVISGLSSLRGCALNFKFFSEVLEYGLPSWTVIQNWIFRFGLYKILQPLPKRKDWIWVIDHTIEFGTKKCMVVLAISHEEFMKKRCQLTHQDMKVAAIDIQENANGRTIYQTLKKLAKKIGKPLQIVSDRGSNIKAGASMLKIRSKKSVITYDITHKAANELKRMLKIDHRWFAFKNKMATTKRKAINTEFICIAPGRPREKSRWMNINQDLHWTENILRNKPESQPGRLTKKMKKFRQLFGWLDGFKEDIIRWRELLTILNLAQKEVKENGLSSKTLKNFLSKVKNVGSDQPRAVELKARMVEFFKDQLEQFPKRKITLLGTSDIIESIFGKYKIFSARTPMKEVSKSILTIPIIACKVTPGEVKKAMETISSNKLYQWAKQNIGDSIFTKRKQAFVP